MSFIPVDTTVIMHLFKLYFENSKAKEFSNIKIIRYEENIYYANVENFKYRIIKLVGINPITIINQQIKLEKKMNKVKQESVLEKLRKKIKPKKSLLTIKQNGILQVASNIFFLILKFLNVFI